MQAIICDLFDVLFLPGDPTRHREYETRLGLPEHGLRQAMLHSNITLDYVKDVLLAPGIQIIWPRHSLY